MCVRGNVLPHRLLVRRERDPVDHRQSAYAVLLVEESIPMRLGEDGKFQEAIGGHGSSERDHF